MSLKVGHLLGFMIEIHYSWMFIFLLVALSLATETMPHRYPGLSQTGYWAVGFIASALLFASVLFHELSHSVVARKYGLAISKITLFFFGGISEITEEPESPSVEFKMAVAGPTSSLLLASTFALLKPIMNTFLRSSEITAIIDYGIQINFLLGLFNLLPAYPMDGGRILRAIIWKLKDNVVAATKIASRIGVGFAYVMILAGAVASLFRIWEGLWYVLIGLFLKSGAQSSLAQTLISKALVGTIVSDLMTKDVVTVPPDLLLNEFADLLLRHKHGGYPVLDEGRLVGLVTMEDLRRVQKNQWSEKKIENVMTPVEKLVTLRPDQDASEALLKMAKYGVGRLLVMDKDILLGIITRSDIMRTVQTRIQLGL